MSHPRIAEVEDDEDYDDPEEMDLDAFDFAQPQGRLGATSSSSAIDLPSQAAIEQLLQQQQSQPGAAASSSRTASSAMPQMSRQDAERMQREQQQKSKHFQCIYPVYFDARRSREDGRRVKKAHAVDNPLARDIVDALQHIGGKLQVMLQIVFEPTKMHPKDWANPGRVRVLVKQDGKPVTPKIHNKHHLYTMIAEYLKAHPTTEESPLKLRIQGMPMPKDKVPTPAIPRGFKIGTILPLHSPALSGGGVSDNMLKDMMDEMGGQLPPGMEGMAGIANMLGGGGGSSGGSAPPKKIKEKKKR